MPPGTLSMEHLMSMLVNQSSQISPLLAGINKDKMRSSLANCRLDERSFRRLDKFDNKVDSWKEWWREFLSAVGEQDTEFVNFLWTVERQKEEVDSFDYRQSEPSC